MDAYCDICESTMKIKGVKGVSVSLICANDKCNQSWHIDENGSSCTILKHLWPQIKEDSKIYRERYLPEWIKEKKHRAIMYFVAGFWSKKEMDEHINKCQNVYDKWFEDHPLIPRPWWKFWATE